MCVVVISAVGHMLCSVSFRYTKFHVFRVIVSDLQKIQFPEFKAHVNMKLFAVPSVKIFNCKNSFFFKICMNQNSTHKSYDTIVLLYFWLKILRAQMPTNRKYSRILLIRTSKLRAPQSTGQLLHQVQLLRCVIVRAHVLCTLNYSTCIKCSSKV